MKKKILKILICPICKDSLELNILKESQEGNIVEGNLDCAKCSAKFEIKNSIPNLIPYSANN
tara:strand:+ start:458 stop:643 length:186 start_codon:yes stop_codon:yes gene_type:complete